MDIPNSIVWWISVAALAAASAIDIRSRRIPNWLAVPFLLSGIAAEWISGGFLGAARGSIAGVAMACAIFALPCLLGAMGLGDLKLAAGVGAWIGPRQFMLAMVITGIAGGILAAGYAFRRGALGRSLDLTGELVKRGPRQARTPDPAALSIPYAPAIAVGTLISFFAR